MIGYIKELLHTNPVLVYFVVFGLGYLIGKTRIGNFEIGPVSGVLFVGLIFGHLGYGGSTPVQSVGFILFIYSVGLQSGPKFFRVIRQDGLKYLSLAFVVGASGFAIALGMSSLFGFEHGTAAGMLAGGLTSSPTLAAAQEAIRAGTVVPREGYTADQVITNISTGYAITYIFGLTGLILIVQLLPRVLGIDLPSEARKLSDKEEETPDTSAAIASRAYRVVKEEIVGIPLSEMLARSTGLVAITKIKREGRFIDIDDATKLMIGDRISVIGPLDRMKEAPGRVGPEISDSDLLDFPTETVRIVVTRKNAAGTVIDRKSIVGGYACVLTRVERLGVEVPIDPKVTLERGDVLFVTGPRAYLDLMGERFGHLERRVDETDLLTFATGIVIGMIVGSLTVSVGGVSVGLGSAGGLLAAGLTIGFLRSVHPTFGRVPSAVRWVFMELGLLFFMVGVGLRAGAGIVEALISAGPRLFISGMLVTTAPILLGYAFGRYVLKLNPALLLGGITGSMTSGASLSIVTREAESGIPALGYTGAYAFANVLLTVAGTVILMV